VTLDDLKGAVRTVPDFPEPGIQFKDITPILADPALLRFAVERLAAPFEDAGLDAVLGIESRGFILGAMLADHLGIGFVPVRKAGKLPAATVSRTYDLEYGTDTVEMHADALPAGARVLVHDDVIATGGTAAATAGLVRDVEAEVAGYAFLIELGFLKGREQLPTGHHERVHVVMGL
jgi:adenine phosphoribosyltransferase